MKTISRTCWLAVAAVGISLSPVFAQDSAPAGRWMGRSGGGEHRGGAREGRSGGDSGRPAGIGGSRHAGRSGFGVHVGGGHLAGSVTDHSFAGRLGKQSADSGTSTALAPACSRITAGSARVFPTSTRRVRRRDFTVTGAAAGSAVPTRVSRDSRDSIQGRFSTEYRTMCRCIRKPRLRRSSSREILTSGSMKAPRRQGRPANQLLPTR